MNQQQFDAFRQQISVTAETLARYGFLFWAEKLRALSARRLTHTEMITEVAALYGGFGTLMDLAVDPCTLPSGVSEEAANQDLLKAINDLYDQVKISNGKS